MNLFSQDQRFSRTPVPNQDMGIGGFMQDQIKRSQPHFNRAVGRPPVPQPGSQSMKFIMDTGMQRAREQKMQEMKQKMMGQMQSQVQSSGAARTPNQQDPRMQQMMQMFQRFQGQPQGQMGVQGGPQWNTPVPRQSFNPQQFDPAMMNQIIAQRRQMMRQPYNPAGQGMFGVQGGPGGFSGAFNPGLWRGR